MRNLSLRILLAAMLSSLPAAAQENIFCFTHLNMDAGLSHNTVLDAMQDSRGFMWFATQDGLNRYDGYQYKVYGYDPARIATSLGNTSTVSLHEGPDGLIWVGTTEGVYIFDPDRESFSFFDRRTPEGIGVGGKITDIDSDRDGNVWIADYSNGIFRYGTATGELACYRRDGSAGRLIANEVTTLCVDRDNTVWAGTLGHEKGGLSCYDPASDRFVLHTPRFAGGINRVVESDDNNLLIGTPQDGVFGYNRVTGAVTKVYSESRSIIFVSDIMLSPEKLWIGTSEGIILLDRRDGTARKLTTLYSDRSSLSCAEITAIRGDRDGGIWICTLSGGVNYLPSTYADFEKYYPLAGTSGLKGKQARHFSRDGRGRIWIATEQSELTLFDPAANRFVANPLNPAKLSGNNIQTVLADGDKLWVGYIGKGLDEINLRTGAKKNHYTDESGPPYLNDNSILSLCKDSEGNLWVGTTRGANLLERSSINFESVIPRESGEMIYDIMEESGGTIWFASYTQGAWNYNPRTGEWRSFRHVPSDSSSLGSDRATGLFEDSGRNVWVLTEGGGLSRYVRGEGRFITYTTANGLPNNVVQEMAEDADGRLWISTNRGLSSFDPSSGTFRNYSFAGGPLSDQFWRNSGLTDSDGQIYFGCTEGFIRFDPSRIRPDTTSSPLYITDFRIFNREVEIGGKDSPLERTIVNTRRLRLGHRQNSFSLGFSILDYNSSSLNQYAYKMEGYDAEWIYSSGEHRVTYTNMPPGKYHFRVAATNSNGVWDRAGREIEVVIEPPVWLSGWAVCLYCILTLLAGWYVLRSYLKRQEVKRERMIDDMNREQEKAIYEAKISFFTGISHEVRTPLSLIRGPFEMLGSSGTSEEERRECMEVMGDNIERLQVLTDQMLDISKIERQGFVLDCSLTDINGLIEGVLKSFAITFRRQGIRTTVSLPQPPVVSYVDREMFIKIVTNLVGNATKYCRREIGVELSRSGELFSLSISNDGKPVARQYREKIFETFYRAPGSEHISGIGIGLSLVKQFVEMHRGRVYVDETVADRTCFTVEIPVVLQLAAVSDGSEEDDVSTADERAAGAEGVRRPVILIAEDDRGMRAFLRKLLSKSYRVFTVNDGETALRFLEQRAVDLVLTDVMMPGMDGVTLCRRIKSREAFATIPVVLLTARSGMRSRIDGMEAGADEYLEKPFSPQFLLVRISNILNNRRLSKEAFRRMPGVDAVTSDESAEDERFMYEVYDVVARHLGEQAFTVDMMADELHLGRSSLYRRIKRVTGMNPNDLVRCVRLDRAAEMIEAGELRINEICYLTGFSSSSYFAKCFKAQFGVLPKDYLKTKRG